MEIERPYLKIYTDIWEEILLDGSLSKNEQLVIKVIIRLTIGYRRKKVVANAKYISKYIRNQNKNIHVINRTIKKLIDKKILRYEDAEYKGKKTRALFLNPDYTLSSGYPLLAEQDFKDNISTHSAAAPAAAEGVCADISNSNTADTIVSDTDSKTNNVIDSNAEKFDELFCEFFKRKRNINVDFVEKKTKRLERWGELLKIFDFDKLHERLSSFGDTKNKFFTITATNKYCPALFELFCNQGIDEEKDKVNNNNSNYNFEHIKML
jgi:hypothetical protein